MKKSNLKVVMLCVIGVLIFILIAIFSLFILLHLNNGKKYDQKISLGDKYLQELKYEDAELAYIEAISINKKEQQGYVKLAQVYMEVEEFERAREVIDLGLKQAEETAELKKLYKAVDLKIKEKEEQTQVDVRGIYEEFYTNQFNPKKCIAYLVDVTQDQKEELIVVDLSTVDYDGLIQGYVYTLQEETVVELEHKIGGQSHMAGFFSWYLYPSEEGWYLGEETFEMWQGYGEQEFVIYTLDDSGNRESQVLAQLSTENPEMTRDDGSISEDAYNAYIDEVTEELKKSLCLYQIAASCDESLLTYAEEYLFTVTEDLASALDKTKAVLDSYGYYDKNAPFGLDENYISLLEFEFKEGTLVEHSDCYEVEALFYEGIQVPGDLTIGDEITVVTNVLTNETMTLVYRNNELFEVGDTDLSNPMYYMPSEDGSDVYIYQYSEDRVNRLVYEGPIFIRKDATSEVLVADSVETVSAESLNGYQYYQILALDSEGYVKRLIYTSD